MFPQVIPGDVPWSDRVWLWRQIVCNSSETQR